MLSSLLPLLLALPAAHALPPDLRASLSADAGLPQVAVASVDRKEQEAQEATVKEGGVPYAVARPVSVDFAQRAAWQTLADGRQVGRLRVLAPRARNLSVAFFGVVFPEGAELWVHDAGGADRRTRPLTAADARRGSLWTPVVNGDDLVVSVVLPAGVERPSMTLSRVHVGYRKLGEGSFLQGSCNIDTACPEGDDWREEIASVAVYGFSGTTACTGFMINNTAEDEAPLFATANHCGLRSANASSVTVYWNYVSPACGDLSGGSLNDYQSGSTLRMRDRDSDWALAELDAAPDEAWAVSWAGWDASGAAPTSAVAIHHPGTDEKAISFENDALRITEDYGYSENLSGTHILVPDWDLGTTEGGSSGSPLFDQDHRAVGVLTGGYAACGNDEADWYGRLYSAWDASSSESGRLDVWLDPGATGATTTDTLAPWASGVVVSPTDGLSAQGPEGGPFTPATATVTLRNRDDQARVITASASADWVEVAASTTVSANNTGTLRLGLSTAAAELASGVYEAAVTVTHNGDAAAVEVLPVRLVVGTRAVRYAWPLDRNPGWDTEGDWAFGVPEGGGGSDGRPDPTSGYTGDNVYGYNLAGDYDRYLRAEHLTTGPLDLRNTAGTTLSFQRWLGVEEGAYDQASISVSTDGIEWTTVWENPSGEPLDGGAWVEQSVDIGAWVDGAQAARIRWTMGSTDESVEYCGWNLDDIVVSAVQIGDWEDAEPEPDPDTGDTGTADGADGADGTGAADGTDTTDGGADTGPGVAPGVDPGEIKACAGCASGPARGGAVALLLGVLALARRRR